MQQRRIEDEEEAAAAEANTVKRVFVWYVCFGMNDA